MRDFASKFTQPTEVDPLVAFPNYEYHNALPGDGVYNEEKDIVFLLIPKCATSVMRAYAEEHDVDNVPGWTRIELKQVKRRLGRVVVILRDPIERFISTLNMYLTFRSIHEMSNFVTFVQGPFGWYLESNDSHFIPQQSFLKDVYDFKARFDEEIKIDYFYYNRDIYNQINAEYDLDIDAKKIMGYAHKMITGVDETVIRQAYRVDYEIINSVKFKNKML